MTKEEFPKISEEILVALDVIEEGNPRHLIWALMKLNQLSQPMPMANYWFGSWSVSWSWAGPESWSWSGSWALSESGSWSGSWSVSWSLSEPKSCSWSWSEFWSRSGSLSWAAFKSEPWSKTVSVSGSRS